MILENKTIQRYSKIVGYSDTELEKFKEGGHRIRHVNRLAEVAPFYSIEAKVISSKNCIARYKTDDRFILDIDGCFISKLCPKRMCVYLVSQLTVPVALINERLSEGLDPNDFHFMKYVRCPDVGVDCAGYGEVMLSVKVIPRKE